MTIPRQSGPGGGDFAEGAASFRNYADQMRYKHPWCAQSHAPTILLLPSFEGGLFYLDRIAHLCDGMCQVAMQTLAVGCQFALSGGVLPPARFVPLALFPEQAGFTVFLNAPQLIIVLRVIGATLPLHLALQSPLFAGIGGQFLAERDQVRFSLLWHNGERRWADIKTDDIGSCLRMLWLEEGVPL